MSWESPIELVRKYEDIQTKELENGILTEVTSQLGVKVNKEELKNALAYSHNSYNKGYQDGYADMYDRHKEKLLVVYTDLLSSFEGDKSALKKIDMVFDKPLEELNK